MTVRIPPVTYLTSLLKMLNLDPLDVLQNACSLEQAYVGKRAITGFNASELFEDRR